MVYRMSFGVHEGKLLCDIPTCDLWRTLESFEDLRDGVRVAILNELGRRQLRGAATKGLKKRKHPSNGKHHTLPPYRFRKRIRSLQDRELHRLIADMQAPANRRKAAKREIQRRAARFRGLERNT